MLDTSHSSDAKSVGSYKSTRSSRSSVLQRAREYNRRIDEQTSFRSKSADRQSQSGASAVSSALSAYGGERSRSAGREYSRAPQGNRISTRERAMATVRRESTTSNSNREQQHRHSNREDSSPRASSSAYSATLRPKPTTPRRQEMGSAHEFANGQSSSSHQRSSSRDIHQQQQRSSQQSKSQPRAQAPPQQNKTKSPRRLAQVEHDSSKDENPNQAAIVTPELLVDALSGHEDGLLAIAERLMEHYDSGYDVMGEAIIDAFADVQKLFQHVVEAAHMEGAAFEASRREQEMVQLRKQAAAGGIIGEIADNPISPTSQANGPGRHDEFIDQDIKDVLVDAIRQGSLLREANKHVDCYNLYEQASQKASELLPVDSDHRGRLQLSIARAESMSPDRSCAILRYAMDDVLRSGLQVGKYSLPDPSKRADVVLRRPKGHQSTNGVNGHQGVVQSPDEALASLVEEMREVLTAPVYDNTPMQDVASRFLAALNSSQKSQQKDQERLEQSLAKLKGDFLLARAEWEEKLTSTKEALDSFKGKYQKLKTTMKKEGFMDSASTRSIVSKGSTGQESSTQDDENASGFLGSRSSSRGGGGSVASLGSGLAQHARSIVGSFQCVGNNQRSGPIVAAELAEGRDAEIRQMAFRRADDNIGDRARRNNNHHARQGDRSYSSIGRNGSRSGSSSSRSKQQSRSFREYSSPRRVDV